MADQAEYRFRTLDELFEILRTTPAKSPPAPEPETPTPTPESFDQLLHKLFGSLTDRLTAPSASANPAPTPADPPEQQLLKLLGLAPKPTAPPPPEPLSSAPTQSTPAPEPVQEAEWTPSTPGTEPSYTLHASYPDLEFDRPHSVSIPPTTTPTPTPAPTPPANAWSTWKVAATALGVLGVAGLGYLGARRFQQLEQTVDTLLGEFQRGFNGKLRALQSQVAAIEVGKRDQTDAVAEVRREVQAELAELRSHREWLRGLRANAPADAAREAEAQLNRAERELDALFARIDRSGNS